MNDCFCGMIDLSTGGNRILKKNFREETSFLSLHNTPKREVISDLSDSNP